jgi:RimJ/RimL family protein N-acetyltransferase
MESPASVRVNDEPVVGFVVENADVKAISPFDGDKFPTLVGKFCRLERLEYRHAPELYAAFSADGAKLWTYMFNGPFNTEEEFLTYLIANFIGPSAFCCAYAIIDSVRNSPVGLASYLCVDTTHKSVEVGYITFSGLMKRSLIATEAMYLMARAAFEAGYRRYEWKCNSLNKPSALAAQRLGFTYEGLFVRHRIAKGLNRDTAWFSITDLDWVNVQQCFEQYLHPSNFRTDGSQIISLSSLTSPYVHRRFIDSSDNGELSVGVPVKNASVKAMSPFDSSFPSMIGKYCRLERLGKHHIHGLYEAFCAEPQGMWAYMFFGPFADEEAFTKFFTHSYFEDSETRCGFAIIDNVRNIPVGSGSYLNIDTTHKSVEVGNLIFSSLMKRSLVSTEAMYLMAKAAFAAGYRRYEWKCNSLNGPSVSAAQRLGFSFEAIFRQHYIAKGRNRDTAYFAMIDVDWPSIEKSFKKYLDPSNFEENGRQLISLSSLTAPFVHNRFP